MKKVIALCLALTLLVAMLPLSVFADGVELPIVVFADGVEYTWAPDYSTCTADDGETQEEVTATYVTTPASCTQPEMTTYTATFTTEGFEQQVKTVQTAPALGHKPGEAVQENVVGATCTTAGSYDEVVYCTECQAELSREPKTQEALGHKWSINYAWNGTAQVMAYGTCSGCDAVLNETADTVANVVTAATCTEPGQTTYTATFQNEALESQSKTVDVLALGHDLIHHDAQPASCTEAGWDAYDTCSRCDYTTKGAEIPATGHTWGEVTYTWSEDNKTCTATRTCATDESHVETETVNTTSEVTVEPTEEAPGVRTYTTATFKNEAFTTQTKDVEEKYVAFVWGDANGDGKVDNKDIVRLKKYFANFDDETETSTVEIYAGADANGDGIVSNKDIVRLKNYFANYDEDTGNSTYPLGSAE